MNTYSGFVLGRSIAVLACLLLPSLASAKESPNSDVNEQGGLLSACEDPSNLVRNCGFETGDLSSWTYSGDPSFVGANTASRHTGNYGAFLGPVGDLGYLGQTLATTAGARYFIAFWLRNRGTPSSWTVFWAGNLLYGWPNVADFDYIQIAIGPVVATTANTDLVFAFQNDPEFFFLDDVVVYASPAE